MSRKNKHVDMMKEINTGEVNWMTKNFISF